MKNSQLCLIIFTITLLSIGQVLFKYASGKINFDQNGFIDSIILNPALILAICIYGVATLAWVIVLSGLELRVAYPFAALAFLIVPALSWIFLGEDFNSRTLLGGVVIMLGVYISSF